MTDLYNLQRFVAAQEPLFDQVLDELREGRKRSHWIWFIFPQIQGLGRSERSRRYAISSRDEAEAYLHHPLLGPRLVQCVELVNAVDGRSIEQIFGSPDDVKFHSSITLFHQVAPDNEVFVKALEKYFGGKLDSASVEKLRD